MKSPEKAVFLLPSGVVFKLEVGLERKHFSAEDYIPVLEKLGETLGAEYLYLEEPKQLS